MNDKTTETNQDQSRGNQQDTFSSLMDQVTNDLRKSERDAVKAKLKTIALKRQEAEKTIRLLDLEAKKLVDDFVAGL